MIKLSAAALAYARQPGFSALVFSDVKTPTGKSVAYKQAAADDLSQMGLVALTENTFYGMPAGRSSERTTMAVVAQINNDADRWLRSVVGGRPLTGSVKQAAGNFGAITLRDGSAKAKVQLLLFDGDAYGVFAFAESTLLLNEPQSSERLSLAQRLMIVPMVRSAAAELVAAQDVAIARYTAKSASEMLEPKKRCASSKKLPTNATCGALSAVSLRRPRSTSWWPPSRCRASRAWAPSTSRRSSSRMMTATEMRRGVARRWIGSLPVSRRLPLPSYERTVKYRAMVSTSTTLRRTDGGVTSTRPSTCTSSTRSHRSRSSSPTMDPPPSSSARAWSTPTSARARSRSARQPAPQRRDGVLRPAHAGDGDGQPAVDERVYRRLRLHAVDL